jgi:hypothetical protein
VSDRLVVASTHTRSLCLPRVGSGTRFSGLAELFPHPAIVAVCDTLDSTLSTRKFGMMFALLHRVSFAVFAQQALRRIVNKALVLRLVSAVFRRSLPAAGLGDLHRACAHRISVAVESGSLPCRIFFGTKLEEFVALQGRDLDWSSLASVFPALQASCRNVCDSWSRITVRLGGKADEIAWECFAVLDWLAAARFSGKGEGTVRLTLLVTEIPTLGIEKGTMPYFLCLSDPVDLPFVQIDRFSLPTARAVVLELLHTLLLPGHPVDTGRLHLHDTGQACIDFKIEVDSRAAFRCTLPATL